MARNAVVAVLLLIVASAIPSTPTLLPFADEARSAVNAFGSLLSALVLDPARLAARLASGDIAALPTIERFFDNPSISVASQRISDITIDLTQLQLYAEDVLGIDSECKVSDYRPASRQPARIEGPTLTVTFNTINCSVDGDIGVLIDKHDWSKELFINKTFACDKGLVEFEKVCCGTCLQPPPPTPHTPPPTPQTPLTFTKSYHRAERYRCAECVTSKSFGEEKTIVLFEGGQDKVFESIADFVARGNLSEILPFDTGRVVWQVNAQLQRALQSAVSSPRTASLLATVLDVQQRVSAITDALFEGLDSKVNSRLEKLLDASLSANVGALERIVKLLS